MIDVNKLKVELTQQEIIMGRRCLGLPNKDNIPNKNNINVSKKTAEFEILINMFYKGIMLAEHTSNVMESNPFFMFYIKSEYIPLFIENTESIKQNFFC